MVFNYKTTAAMFTVLFLAILLGDKVIYGLQSDFADSSFTYSLYLDDYEKYQLFWRYDEKDITFKAKVETKGYIGFGLSGTGGMKGSDIVIGWVKDGQGYLKDRHAEGNMLPKEDPEQNWKLLDAEEDQKYTTLVFTRPLRSCDTQHDMNIQRETQRIIWAHNANDPSNEDAIPYHGSTTRGSKSVYLMLDQPGTLSLPSNVQSFDIRTARFHVPSAATTYWRTAYKLPELSDKHHIIGFEPLINEKNKGLVHHMLLYICTATEIEDTMHGKSWNAYRDDMPSMNSCEGIMFGWGVGGGSHYMPDKVGFPLGGDSYMKFVMLDSHYDNPEKRSDIYDDSGLRLFYTSTLRPQEAGMLFLGMSVSRNHVIPPHAEYFRSTGFCPGECTKKGLASRPEGINMFAGVLHSHLLGRRMRLRHVRNGTELKPILSDETFDFNFQESRSMLEEVTVMPGDDLILECDYGSKHLRDVTRGGIGTQQEMCLAFVMYYPYVNFKDCHSCPTVAQSLSFIDSGLAVSYDERVTTPGQYYNKTLLGVMRSMDWTNKENIESLEKAVSGGRIDTMCGTDDAFDYDTLDAPAITKPYVKELDFCSMGAKLQETAKDGMAAPEDFQHWAELEKDKVFLMWTYDEVSISFQLVVKTLGWVGFGLSPNGEMENSDVVIGWVKDHRVQFSDRFADSNRMPKIDPLQNWVAETGWEENGYTKLKFTRNLFSCDPLDRNITEGNMHIIWAYDDQDPQDASSIFFHAKRGTKVLRLLNGPLTPNAEKLPEMTGKLQIEFKNPTVPITTQASTYYNVGFKMPELDGKHQLIKVEPLIEPGHEKYIYHFVVFGCTDEVPDEFHGHGFDTNEGIVPEIMKCSTLLAFWLNGNEAFEYPPSFGFPIGGSKNPVKFIRFETLFHNPEGKTGLLDSSGVRLTLIPGTRDEDIGLLRVGHSGDFGWRNLIAPGETNYLMRGYCTADCLSKGLRSQPRGVSIIGVTLHSHALATDITLRHIRNGKEIPPILKEPNFVFTNQEIVMLEQPVKIRPGDEIIIDCKYNTTSEKTYIMGGPWSNNQPCLALLMINPPINLGICESASPATEILAALEPSTFNFTGSPWNANIESPVKWKGKNFWQIFPSLDAFDETQKKALQTAMTEGSISNFCFGVDEMPEIKLNQEVSKPPKFEYRQEPAPFCPENIRGPTRTRPTTGPVQKYTTPRDGAASASVMSYSTALLCLMFVIFRMF